MVALAVIGRELAEVAGQSLKSVWIALVNSIDERAKGGDAQDKALIRVRRAQEGCDQLGGEIGAPGLGVLWPYQHRVRVVEVEGHGFAFLLRPAIAALAAMIDPVVRFRPLALAITFATIIALAWADLRPGLLRIIDAL